MKKYLLIFFLILCNKYLIGQSVPIIDIWHLQKGDISREEVAEINKCHTLKLKYDEIVTIQFAKKKLDTTTFYKFRISNADDYRKWRDIGSEPLLRFPSLEGGSYELEIRGNPKNEKHKYRVLVQQTFWQEWWFWPSIVFYVLCLLGIASYFFFIYNLRQKLKVQEIRNRIAADLHDEVGSNLSSIAIFVELLRKKAPVELNPILDKITSNSKESVQLMQDTIWAIQAKNDDFQKFIEKMKDFSRTILSAKNISLNFDCQISDNKNVLTMDQRKNAYLIFKESINNIAKHANATKVNVKIWNENEYIFIEVLDNGQGFDTDSSFSGNGLLNFKQRAAESDMHIDIYSEQGKGTRILLHIRID